MLNWSEVHLLLSELPLEESYIQKVTEHSIHSLTFSLFHRDEKAWLLHAEVATQNAHFARTDRIRKKSEKNQRFTQYLRKHIVGARITEVIPFPYDRAFALILRKDEGILKMVFRFWSGPGANIIITDENDRILELMFRRPGRGEGVGDTLAYGFRENEGPRHFEPREWDAPSFNEFIDRYYDRKERGEDRAFFTERLEAKRDRELSDIRENIRKYEQRLKSTTGYESMKKIADLLSSSLYTVRKGMTSVELIDWENDDKLTVNLDPALSPNDNLQKYYEKYQKDRKTHEMTLSDIEDEKKKLAERTEYWEKLLSDTSDLGRLRREASFTPSEKTQEKRYHGVDLESHGFTLIIGRNSRENDQILRHDARGNDTWMHTRDYAGGYVIIKCRRDKTIPLEVLLDAGNLAIHYSKAKNEKKADLYYTEVKYLRRVKNGKEGLVLPTQEKNLFVEYDEKRVRDLLKDKA